MYSPFDGITIGPLFITFYGIIIATAVCASYLVAQKRAAFYAITQQQIDSLLPFLLVGSIVSARLYHVVDKWEYYRIHILETLFIWHGGIGIYGAILGGLIVLFWYSKKHNLSLLSLLDLIAPSLAFGQVIGRWGNFFNQEAFGPPTNLPWKIYIDSTHRPIQWQQFTYFHPVFLYESLLNLLAFFVLMILAKRFRAKSGTIAGLYFVFYGLIRLVTEQFRFDTATIGPLKVATLISLGCIIGGIVVVQFATRRNVKIAVH